jgi:hypothetical protein
MSAHFAAAAPPRPAANTRPWSTATAFQIMARLSAGTTRAGDAWSTASHPNHSLPQLFVLACFNTMIGLHLSIHGEYWEHSGSGQRLRRPRFTHLRHRLSHSQNQAEAEAIF